MNQFKISDFDKEVKVKILKALIEGKIKKEELIQANPEEISVLLSNQWALMHIQMGDEHHYHFRGNKINLNEFERLDKLCKALGVEEMKINVVPTGVPLAYNDR